MEKYSVVYCSDVKLVDNEDSVTVIEGKEGMTRSALWQHCVGLGLLFISEQGEIEARGTVWGGDTSLGRRCGANFGSGK